MASGTCVCRRSAMIGGASVLCWFAVGCADDGGQGTGADDESGAECGTQAWLTGGTASMAGDYPSPFEALSNPACALGRAQGCGPCYDPGPDRKDISDGEPGLPMRVNLRIIYEGTCEPVAGATVDIFWTNVDGVYSGRTPSPGCALDDPNAPFANWMRGRQSSNAVGEVEFDACYPSWYPARAPHVHILIIIDQELHYATQLYFPDDLSADIFANHADYNHRPVQAITNLQDGAFDPASPNFMETRRTYDCAMQAWATIAIPEAPTDPSC